MSKWHEIMRRKGALLAGVVAGIASPASFANPAPYVLPQGNDLERMRGDWRRVGLDLSAVIEREHGKQTAARTAKR